MFVHLSLSKIQLVWQRAPEPLEGFDTESWAQESGTLLGKQLLAALVLPQEV